MTAKAWGQNPGQLTQAVIRVWPTARFLIGSIAPLSELFCSDFRLVWAHINFSKPEARPNSSRLCNENFHSEKENF
jgi:hypothetical protein